MADFTFEDLAKFGIEDGPVQDAREELVQNVTAEDFLAHMGIEVPDDPSDQFYADADAILAHYGVLGMKWGRRKQPDGRVVINKEKTAGNHPGHSDRQNPRPEKPAKPAKPAKAKPRPAKEMTNEELQTVIKRMQLEQQYKQLTTPKKPVLLAETQKIVANALRQNAQAYATQYTGVAIGALLKKAGVPNAKEIADAARKANEKADKDQKQD